MSCCIKFKVIIFLSTSVQRKLSLKIGLKILRRLFYFISISMQSCVAKIVQEHSIDTTTSYLIWQSSVSTLVYRLPTLRKNKI